MDGWNSKNCRRFQLPHPDHPEEGHQSAVYTIQVQGNHLVSGSADKTLRIWNVESQRLVRRPLLGHEGSVLCLQFDAASEEDIIISGGTDSAVFVRQFSTGEIIRKIPNAHHESVLSLAFDDRYLITGSKDRSVKIWTRHTISSQDELVPQFVRTTPPVLDEDLMIMEYSLLATLDHHAAAVNAVQICGDSILSGGGDASLCLWNIHTGQVTRTFNIHKRGIACLWTNGRFAVSGSSDQTVKVLDLKARSELATLTGYNNLIRSLQVAESKDGKPSLIVTGSYDGVVKIWSRDGTLNGWALKAELEFGSLQPRRVPDDPMDKRSTTGHPDRVFHVQISGRKVFCSGQGNVIEGWEFDGET